MRCFEIKPKLTHKINFAVDEKTFADYMRLRSMRVDLPSQFRYMLSKLIAEVKEDLDFDSDESSNISDILKAE